MSVKRLEELLNNDGLDSVCEHCPYYHEWYESHPYGDCTAHEFLAECTCNDDDECCRLEEIK